MPGQFNMVSVLGVGEAPISFSSNPESREALDRGIFQHTIRAVGNVTKALARLQAGEQFWVRGPYGTGWPRDLARRDLTIIAGGIGLAPLRPVILQKLEEKGGRLEILYGARTPGDMIFRDEFPDWEARGARLLLTVDRVPEGENWPHRVGLVTNWLQEMEVRPEQGSVFICGPEIMMKYVVRGLTERNWRPQRIFVSLERRMECGIKICGRCQIDSEYVCQDGPVFSHAVVKDLLGTDL
jgi:NAD(P)H-flavin reductase